MVHNGIEYGDMQLIAEAYALMREGLNLSVDEIQAVFARWNTGVLDSYLIEITAQILKVRDADGEPLIDKIQDRAAQKGTGKWTGINALDLGVPLTLIGEAVFARCLSALKDERVRASLVLSGGAAELQGRPRGLRAPHPRRPLRRQDRAPTPRATCSCARRHGSTAGNWTWAMSP